MVLTLKCSLKNYWINLIFFKMKNIIVPVFIIIVSVFLTGCEIEEIRVLPPSDLKVEELSMQKISLTIMLPIKNPNNFSFRVRASSMDVYVNDRRLGKLDNITRLRIPRNSEDTYPVNFELKTSDAIGNILPLIRDLQTGRPRLAIRGNIRFAKFPIYKTVKVNHEQVFDIY